MHANLYLPNTTLALLPDELEASRWERGKFYREGSSSRKNWYFDTTGIPFYIKRKLIQRGLLLAMDLTEVTHCLLLSLADCCRVQHFREIYPDTAFNKSIIHNVTVDEEDQCQLRCYLQTDCKSYNLGPLSQQGKRVCELSSSRYESHVSHLVSRPGFIYRPSEVSSLLWDLGKRMIASREETEVVLRPTPNT